MSLWKTVSILVVVLFIPTFAFSDTIIVPDDHPTIQGAIDAAVNGDTVLVKPGTYVENIDFNGKAITVKSSDGPNVTIIDGGNPINPWVMSVVVFHKGEVQDSVMKGFTITNGAGTTFEIGPNWWEHCGGGIFCIGAAPTIIGCKLIDNFTYFGGGLFNASDSSPTLMNCIISGNGAWLGGGIGSERASTTVINCTIIGNWALGAGGGFCNIDNFLTVTNSIVWGNSPDQILNSSVTSPTVTYCDIDHGYPGTGNIDLDPKFVDSSYYDFHIQHSSPCRDTGTNAIPSLPDTDFEGDPRIAYGTSDMGADEFYTHLYCMGDFTPGGAIEGKFIGLPGTTPVGLFIGSDVLPSPMNTMWGEYWLQAPWLMFGPLGAIPSTGVMVLPTTLPSGMTVPVDIPMQALIGLNTDSLTNLCVLEVR